MMQLLNCGYQGRVRPALRSWSSQSGLLPVCRARPLIRQRKACLRVKAQSRNSQTAPQPAPTDGRNQLVPQNGTSNGTNLPAAPGANGGPAKVNVHFEVPEYLTNWGQVLKVVGSLDELGNWKVEKAPQMEWHEGHTWTLDVQLPVGAVNFKVVMQEPHGGVRWEEGSDRSVMIPETTSVTGAPVGEVDVTCNFNDVNNSRVEVLPNRNYLKQQLKAVEARVMAIQEKKRKLDQRMSVLTEGLKNYDQTVALLEGDVQDAIAQRQRSKEQAAVVQQQLEASQQQSQPAAAAAKPVQPSVTSNGSIMVPILNPEELPSFDDLSYTTLGSSSDVETAEDIAAASAAASDGSSMSSSMASSDDDAGPSSAAGSMSVNAIKASHVNETVLSATVDQLLAAAEDALARSNSTAADLGANASSKMESNGVNSSELAEEYVQELLAAASALEQQADQRANMLLEAAKQTGNDVMIADMQQLTTAPAAGVPTNGKDLAEAAAAEAAAAVETMTAAADGSSSGTTTADEEQELQAVAVVSAYTDEAAAEQSEEVSKVDTEPVESPTVASETEAPAAAAAAVGTPAAQVESPMVSNPQEQEQPASTSAAAEVDTTVPEPPAEAAAAAAEVVEPAVASAATAVQAAAPATSAAAEAEASGSSTRPSAPKEDGTITFTAESLSAEVDAKELLAAVMKRIGIPLSAMSNVVISAKFTPAQQQQQQQMSDAQEDGAQIQKQQEVIGEQPQQQPAALEAQQQQQDVQQQGEPEELAARDSRWPKSPADAIAAAIGAAAAALTGRSRDSDDDGSSGTGGSSQPSRSSRWGGSSSSSNGKYSRTSDRSKVRSKDAARPASAAAAADDGIRVHPRYIDLAQEAEKQLAAKEAARRAAAEKVAAALAQVEEMRKSVFTTNSLLAEQLHSSSDSSTATSSPAAAAKPAAPSSSGGSSDSSSGRSYSRYRVNYKDSPAVADTSSSGPRSMPTVAAAAVAPAQRQRQQQQSGSSSSSGEEFRVEGAVKEELLALAALAATVQSVVDVERDYKGDRNSQA